MKKLTTLILSCLLIYTLVLTTACPKKSAIRRANEASFQLAGTINDAQKALENAYAQGIVTNETALKLNYQLRIANEGSQKLTVALRALRTEFPNGELPANKIEFLNQVLSDEIITPVLRILDELKIVDGSKTPALLAAISSIKSLIVIISAAFPQKSAQMEILERRKLQNV